MYFLMKRVKTLEIYYLHPLKKEFQNFNEMP